MSKITNIKILEEFTNKDDGTTYGIYWVKFDGKDKLFLRNGNFVSTYSHYLDKAPRECVDEIRDDVREEFLNILREMKR